MNISTPEIKWAKNALKNKEVICEKIIANTDYSFVVEIQCKNRLFFLKKNHSIFNYEDKLLSYLYHSGINNLNIYHQNQDLNCFITEFCGVQITNVAEHCISIADKFIEIQLKSNPIVLADIGLRRFSTSEISYLCYKYQIHSEHLLKYWNEIEKVIPLSLEHGDFHLGNILIDENEKIVS